MMSVLELAPVVIFGAAYFYSHDIYVATAALMVSMAALLAVDLAWKRRIPMMHALSAALVFVLGTATLILHNKQFIQWKPTVLFWVVSAAFLGSFWIGQRTLTERMYASALGESVTVPRLVWQRLNVLSVVFYALLGGANLLVAHYASERAWVNFKLFGLTAATVVFALVQLAWLSRHLPREATT